MGEFLRERIRIYISRHRTRKVFRNVLRVMGCIVAFVTTYALILPAITMEKKTFCGLEEHTHIESCYVQQYQRRVILCNSASLGIHVHSASCYDENGKIHCGLTDYVEHSHDSSCYDHAGILLCTLPERTQHVHDSSCFYTPEPVPHAHTDACMVRVKGEQICGQEEYEGHSHGASCYQTGAELQCTVIADHQHADSCYAEEAACIIPEGHTHSDACYKQELTCEIPESAGHTHNDDCYAWNTEYGCGLETGAPEASAPVQVCQAPVVAVHVHSDDCFETIPTAADTICGEDHIHDYTCYEISCAQVEHVHSLPCYSDPTADVETREFWESTMKDVELTGDWNADIVAIAESQLGYTESTRNYTVWADGSTHGYTRYGAWYGVPHGDWCGMFASFCLNYAGVKEMPYHYGVRPWIEKLSVPELDLYRTAEEYIPVPGDLVFFDWDADELSDHVGIVYEILEATEEEPAKLKTIEGNSSNCVQFKTYPLDDEVLLGYSMIPENPDKDNMDQPDGAVYYCGLDEHDHTENCNDADGNPICQMIRHLHEESCLVAPPAETVFFCGLEMHVHERSCYNDNWDLTCEQTAHEHTEDCLTAEIRYYCGQEVHIHEDLHCYDEAGNLTCQQPVHEHVEACLTEAPTYYCGQDVHTHDAALCYDEAGNLRCEKEEHVHVLRCQQMPMTSTPYYCGQQEHSHMESCYDETGNLTCLQNEHTHSDTCRIRPAVYYCGIADHTHSDSCLDSTGGLICDSQEHIHTSLCRADLSDLDEDAREKVEKVICMIDEIPSADELIEKAEELAEAGDEEAEEQWMTEAYQQIALAYRYYSQLEEPLQLRIVNSDKLMELDFVWSRMPLATHHVWLDGSNGGIMSLKGAKDEYRQFYTGEVLTLPTEWTSPPKYHYVLRGWYDIKTNQYYAPGSQVEIREHRVFYADWQAATYDVGVFNNQVADTVSTNDFVTTHVFDYSSIFNMYSSSHSNVSLSNSRHEEEWSVVARGSKLPNGNNSYGLVLRDWDEDGNGSLSYPKNFSSQNHYTFQESITTGLLNFNPNPVQLFFNPNNTYNPQTGTGVMGVQYIGTGDHLFQYEDDPDSEYYGYYYYDSSRNAASYNQSRQRFYVYNYLERAKNSDTNGSDFLPFNSPYANTNGKSYDTLTQNGMTTYQYEDKHSASGYSTNKVGINYWFGMSTDIRFYLPSKPGTSDATGYSNKTIYGDEMVFSFSGDDDVWVLVDNTLILDIGGIHRAKSGTINFSTGKVVVDGVEQKDKSDAIKKLTSGEHHLVLYYTERGSSQSNCHIYFNLSPRFTMSLKKEDLLSNEALEGVTFGVYMDEACTVPATLWKDHASSYGNSIHTFTTNAKGEGAIWGFAAGNTYYIREEAAAEGYTKPNGLIKMVLDNRGVAHYSVQVIRDPGVEDEEVSNPTTGFTATYEIDITNQMINLKVTNSLQEGEAAEVLVRKAWAGMDIAPVTVYLLADGERIREETLSSINNWEHTWSNLPKYKTTIAMDEETGEPTEVQTEIVYTVEEGIVPGYLDTITKLTDTRTVSWDSTTQFTEGNTYLLKTSAGYLATTADGAMMWISDEATAKISATAWWTLEDLNGYKVMLKNGVGYYLRDQIGNPRYFYANKAAGSVTFRNNQFRLTGSDNRTYMMTATVSNGNASTTTNSRNAATVTWYQRNLTGEIQDAPDIGYQIVNTPIASEEQTQLTVTKIWTDRGGTEPMQDQFLYEELQVPVRLLTNGKDSGRTVLLTLKNDWTHTFLRLPVKDAAGETIEYRIVEELENDDWTSHCSDPVVDENGNYSVTVNNEYSYLVDIPVEKRWDISIPDTDKTSVELYLYAATGDNLEAELVSEEPLILSADTDWMGKFQALPLEEAGNLQYYIYEVTEDFTPSYGEPAKIFIDGSLKKVSRVTFQEETGDADVTIITNTPPVTLPHTGASGTTSYTTGGLLLTAAALYLLILKRRKEAKETP